MAKAQISTPRGVTVKIEGTPQEILLVVQDLDKQEAKSAKARVVKKAPQGRTTLAGLLASLGNDGFFKQPRDLGGIRAELEARGHHYPVTTLSGAVLNQVRRRNLRRLQKNDRWFYTR